MGPQDKGSFAKCLALLSATFSKEVSEPKAEAYWAALGDIPVDLVEAGAHRLIRTAPYFPTPAMWRLAIDKVQDATEPLPARLLPGTVSEPTVVCEVCQDTGWAPVEMPTSHIYSEAYRAAHPTTPGVKVCPCWERNPNRRRGKRYGQECER